MRIPGRVAGERAEATALHILMRPGTALFAALLALAFAGCDHDKPDAGPFPVYVVNGGQAWLEVLISRDTVTYGDYWQEVLYESDSVFLDSFPNGTILWVWWAEVDALASDTLDLSPPAEVTISTKTTFLFEDCGRYPRLRVLRQ